MPQHMTEQEERRYLDFALSKGVPKDEAIQFLLTERQKARAATPIADVARQGAPNTPAPPAQRVDPQAIASQKMVAFLQELPGFAKGVAFDTGRMLADIGNPNKTVAIMDAMLGIGQGGGDADTAAKNLGLAPVTVKAARAANIPRLMMDFIIPPAQMAVDTAVILSPIVPTGQGGVRFRTAEDQQAATQRYVENLIGFTGVPIYADLLESYKDDGIHGIVSRLADEPEMVSAALLPLAIATGAVIRVKGANTKSRAYFDQKMTDKNRFERRFAKAKDRQAKVEAHGKKLQDAMIDEIVRDLGSDAAPSLALTVRMTTKVDLATGKLVHRNLFEAMQEEFGIEAERRVLTPEEASIKAQRAQMAEAVERLSQVPKIPEVESAQRGLSPQAQARTAAERAQLGDFPELQLASEVDTAFAAGLTRKGLVSTLKAPGPESIPASGTRLGPTQVTTADVARLSGERAGRRSGFAQDRAPRNLTQLLVPERLLDPSKPLDPATLAPESVRRGGPPAADRAANAATPASPLAGATPERISSLNDVRMGMKFAEGARDALTPGEAQAVGNLLRDASDAEIGRISRVVRTAAAMRDPNLVADIYRKLAVSGAIPDPPVLRSPRGKRLARKDTSAKAAVAAATPITKGTATTLKRLSKTKAPVPIAADTAADLARMSEAIERRIRRPPRDDADMMIPEYPEDTALVPPGTPTPKKGGVVPRSQHAVNFSDARGAASTKGLDLSFSGGEFALRHPNMGEVMRSDSLLRISDAIDAFAIPDSPKIPTGPRKRSRSVDAEFFGLQTLTDVVYPRLERGLKRVGDGVMTPEQWAQQRANARAIAMGALLATRTPAQFSKMLPGRSSSPFASLSDTRGIMVFGDLFRANSDLIAREGEFRALLDNGRALGFKKNTRASFALGEVLDTFITSAREGDTWHPLAHGTTPSTKLTVKPGEGITPKQVARASEAWDSFTRLQREQAIKTRIALDEMFWNAQKAEARRILFTAINEAGVAAPKEVVNIGTGGVRAPIAQFPTTPAGNIKPPHRWRIGPRLEGYIGHAVLDDIRTRVYSDALSMVPPETRNLLSSELPKAMRASAREPWKPEGAPGVVFTKPSTALKHLFPGADNTTIHNFIRSASVAMKEGEGAIDRVVRHVPTSLMSRFLAKRKGEGRPDQIDAVRFLESYYPRVLAKTVFEPVLEKISKDLVMEGDPQIHQATLDFVANIIGERPIPGQMTRMVEKGLKAAVTLSYPAILPGKPILGIINSTQAAIFRIEELGLRNVPAAEKLLVQPAFWTYLLERRLLHESMPLDHFVRRASGTGFKDAFQAVRAVENFVDSFKRMNEARTVDAGLAVVNDAIKGGVSLVDFMALTETYLRASTIAHSLMNTFTEAGFGKLAREGKFREINEASPLTVEHAERRALLHSGMINFFSGRASNVPMWQGKLQRTALGGTLKPVFQLTSFPTGSFAALTQWVHDASFGTTPKIRRQALQAIGSYFAAITAIAGPYAAVPWIDKLDDKIGADGALTDFARAWEKNFTLSGVILGGTTAVGSELIQSAQEGRAPNVHEAFKNREVPDLAPRVGIGQVGPFPGVTIEGIASGRLDVSKPVTTTVKDLWNASVGIGTHAVGTPISSEQEDAINRTFGNTFEWTNQVDLPRYGVPGLNVPIPEDVAIFLPLGQASKQLNDAFEAVANEQHRPGAKLDEKGRPKYIRDASERFQEIFRGRSVASRQESEALFESRALGKDLTNLRQKALRHYGGTSPADAARFESAIAEIGRKHPNFVWDPADFRKQKETVDEKARLTSLERHILYDASESEWVRLARKASVDLQNAKGLSPAQRQRAKDILYFAHIRQSRKAR